jgi:hypothetical protein
MLFHKVTYIVAAKKGNKKINMNVYTINYREKSNFQPPTITEV